MTTSIPSDINPGRVTSAQLKRMTPDERAAVERHPEFIKTAQASAAKWKAMQEERNATMAALQSGLGPLFDTLANYFDHIGHDDTDMAALFALLNHLEAALVAPDIQSSAKVSSAVQAILNSLGTLDKRTVKEDDKIFAAFAAPALSKTNRRNGSATKLKAGRADAESMCKKWFAMPDIYANKAAFVRDVMEKGLCKDDSTVDRWFAEFLRDLEPGPEWLNTFGAKYRKATLSR